MVWDMKATNIIGVVSGAIFRVATLVAVIYVICRGAAICYDYGYRIFTEPAMSTEANGRAVTVTVGSDMSPLDIGKLFESRGLIRDAKLFVLQYYLSEYREDVKAGVFELNTSMTVEDMMAVMAKDNGQGETSE